jgi:anti-sigma factor RsiW
MQPSFDHATEEALESYSMGTLPEAEAGILEEHLLVCAACQDRLTDSDRYLRAVRAAASKLRAGAPADRRGFVTWLPGFFAAPGLAWTLGAVCCLALVGWAAHGWRTSSPAGAQPVAVLLQTVRGEEPAAGASAPTGRPLVLEADLAGLPVSTAYDLIVIDQAGSPVELLRAAPADGRLRAQAPKGLRKGRYWVRLYSGGPTADLLREYALRVE